jgi:Divergent InlB B-repeat domain
MRDLVFVGLIIFGLAFVPAAEGWEQAASSTGDGASRSPGEKASPAQFAGVAPQIPREPIVVPEEDELVQLFVGPQQPTSPEALRSAMAASFEDPAATGGIPLPQAPTTIASFQGIPYTGWYPPDTHIAAGPGHILEIVNSSWRAFTKQGSPATPLISLCGPGGWWTSVLPENVTFCFDPRTAYDQHSGRWVMIAAALDNANKRSWLLVATSSSSDPTGPWCRWALDATVNGSTPSGTWADYPALGLDAQALYLTSNQIPFDNAPAYAKLRILDKAQLYAGSCSNVSWKDFWNLQDPGGGFVFHLQPAHTYGNPGAEYLMTLQFTTASTVTLWKLQNPLSSSPTLTAFSVATQTYALPPAPEQCKSTIRIAPGSGFQNVVYRNGQVTTAHTSACPADSAKSCVRVVQIDPSVLSTSFETFFGAWSSGWYYYFPAVMPDASGNLHLLFYRSKASADAEGCIEARQTGKLAGETQLQSSALVRAGGESHGSLRWGDYSGIAADPQDLDKVWMGAEYVVPFTWSTWITGTSFTAPQPCYALTRTHTGPGGDPVASPASTPGCPAGQYTAGASITLSASPAPGSIILSWSGTANDSSSVADNTLIMPMGSHTVGVAYASITPLANGQPVGGSVTGSTSQSGWSLYTVDLPIGSTNLLVTLSNMSQDADLYVRFNARPDLGFYDCRPYTGGLTPEQCVFASPIPGRWWVGVTNFSIGTISYTIQASWSNPAGLDFYTVTPCRVLDTRPASPLVSGMPRTLQIVGACGIPGTAKAVSLNVTAVLPNSSGNLVLWPADLPKPGASTNFSAGLTRANQTILALATNGAGSLQAEAFIVGGGTVHLILDVNGYFQ